MRGSVWLKQTTMTPTPRPQAPHPADFLSNKKTGRMTAAMRAIAAPGQTHGPRIPRVAVVRGGRIIDEILIKDGASCGVTIGTSEKARIVVRAAVQLPQVFQLIAPMNESGGARYWLRFTDGMSGRVSGVNGIRSLADLRADAQSIGDGIYRVALPEDARGKVSLGDTTFLFQIVASPPPALRPQLPLSVKHGLGLDWGLTIIAAFSFLLHFGVAGAMYSDWLDPIVATDHVTAGLVELNRLPKPPPEIPLDPRVVDPTPVANNTTPTSPSSNSGPTKTKTTTSSSSQQTSRSTSDRDAAALVARAEQMQIDYLTVRSNGSAVKETLDRTAVPPVDLSAAAEKNIGVTHDSKGDLRVTTGGPVTPERTTFLASSETTRTATRTRRLGRRQPRQAPRSRSAPNRLK